MVCPRRPPAVVAIRPCALAGHLFSGADADRLPRYLETHRERNVAFYEKHGYNVSH